MNVLGLVLAAAVAGSAPELAISSFGASGVAEEKADELATWFAQQLTERGLTTRKENVRAIGLVTGTVAIIGTEWRVDVKISALRDGSEVASYTTRARDEQAVRDFLAVSAADLAIKLGVQSASAPAAAPLAKRGRAWIITAAAAGVLLVTSGFLLLFAKQDENKLRDGTGIFTYDDVVAIRGRGETLQFSGVAMFAAGAACAIATLILFGFPRTEAKPAPQIALLPLPGGGAYGAFSFTLP